MDSNRTPHTRERRLALSIAAFLALALSLAAGCSRSGDSTHKELTQRQRDSILGTEPIPGAVGVTHALRASDKAAKAAGALNAQVDSLPH